LKLKKTIDQTPEALNRVDNASQKVTSCMNEFLESLKQLPDSSSISIDQNVAELEELIERELSSCSGNIRSAINVIQDENSRRRTNNDKNVDELTKAIVFSSTAITNATGKLVDMAYNSNKNRREKRGAAAIDATFANGIVDATKNVSSSVSSLQSAIRNAINGNIDEEAIVSSSRSIASATSQLVSATRTKSDSETHNLLSNAAKSVANATAELVSALHRAANIIEDNSSNQGGDDDLSQFGFTGSKAQELQQQMRILKLERELERERRRMNKLKN